MKKRSTTLLIGALAVSALLASCGDDKKAGGTSDAAYCSMIKDYKAKADELNSVFSGDTPDPAATKNAFTTMQGMIHDLDKNPPASIAADVHTMTTAVDKMVSIFDKYDWDFTKLATAPELQDLQDTMTDTKVATASDHLEAYSTDTCGIPPDTTTGS